MRVLDEPAGPLELLHRPPAGHLGRTRPSCPAPTSVADAATGSPPRRPRGPPAGRRGRRPASSHRSGTTFGRVPPAIDADVDGHAVPAAVQRVEPLDEVGRGEDRVAALLGLDAGVGRAAVDGDPGVEDALARRDDVAVRPGALEDEARRRRRAAASPMCGVEVGEPISSSGLATNVSRSNGSGPASAPSARTRVEPREEAALHVADAGPVGAAVGVDAERPGGGGAGVEDRVHVADQQDPRPAGRPVEAGRRSSSRSRPDGSGRGLDVRADVRQEAGDEPADLVDAVLRVAAAVDVDEPLEVGEEGRLRRADRVGQGGQLGLGRRPSRARSRSP